MNKKSALANTFLFATLLTETLSIYVLQYMIVYKQQTAEFTMILL